MFRVRTYSHTHGTRKHCVVYIYLLYIVIVLSSTDTDMYNTYRNIEMERERNSFVRVRENVCTVKGRGRALRGIVGANARRLIHGR